MNDSSNQRQPLWESILGFGALMLSCGFCLFAGVITAAGPKWIQPKPGEPTPAQIEAQTQKFAAQEKLLQDANRDNSKDPFSTEVEALVATHSTYPEIQKLRQEVERLKNLSGGAQ